MGEIIYWALIRTAVLIPLLWIFLEKVDYKFWWIITLMAVYVIIIHPIIIGYQKFVLKSKEVNNTICSTCKNFDKTALICIKHDKHPTKDFIPCEGEHWEPL